MLFIKEKKKRQMIRNINSLLPPFLTQEVKNLTIWMPFFRWNFYVMKIAMCLIKIKKKLQCGTKLTKWALLIFPIQIHSILHLISQYINMSGCECLTKSNGST